MSASIDYKFLQQQGFDDDTEQSAPSHVKGLQFQPTIVGSIMLIAILTQSAILFLAISAILWVNTFFPNANIFEIIYNKTLGPKRNEPALQPAPMPRRFAQGMAATFMLIVGIAILSGWMTVAFIGQAFIAIAFGALLFGKFCLGAYVYQILRGRASFANATCPWSRAFAKHA